MLFVVDGDLVLDIVQMSDVFMEWFDDVHICMYACAYFFLRRGFPSLMWMCNLFDWMDIPYT